MCSSVAEDNDRPMSTHEFAQILANTATTTELVEALDTHFWEPETITANQCFRVAALAHLCRRYPDADVPPALIALVDALHMRTASYNKHCK